MTAAMRASARAHANIALVKYWGKRQVKLNLPDVGSISLTLDGLTTSTTVHFDMRLTQDRLILNGEERPKESARVADFLARVRAMAGLSSFATVTTTNNFPTGAGLASSASGFAALSLAATRAAGLDLSDAELSALARVGSASAARSIFGGFVEMSRGTKNSGIDCNAYQLAECDHWPLKVVIGITSRERKSVGSTEAMQRSAKTSQFYRAWVDSHPADLAGLRDAVAEKDFQRLAEITESSCLKMHSVMMSSLPPLIFWNGVTVDLMHALTALRAQGVGVCYTMDAGPQVKAICEAGDASRVAALMREVPGVKDVLICGLGTGACHIENAPAGNPA